MINDLPDEKQLLRNFSRCQIWEEKYLYLIELGKKLFPLKDDQRKSQNQVFGCQSQVWIVVKKDKDGRIIFLGDSDSAIVKGLIALVIVIFQNKSIKEILETNSNVFFEKLSLKRNLSPSRNQGIYSIVKKILLQVRNLKDI